MNDRPGSRTRGPFGRYRPGGLFGRYRPGGDRHDRLLPWRRRARQAVALGGAACLAAGVLLAAATRSTASAGSGNPGVTVQGPHMWDPATGKAFAAASTVTVNQTSNLVNQMVQVSWTGFTPSSTPLYDPAATDYPVMVTECRGTNPASLTDCYGANNGGVQGAFGPDGPMNTAYATTAANGTGQLDIQILTALENQFLGCDQNHPCSLVVVPAQGGNVFVTPPHCTDHSADIGGSAIGQLAFSTSHGQCSWLTRIVIPLKFAPTPAACPLKNSQFSVAGSPMMARAMAQWLAGLCAGSHGLTIGYNSTVPEPLAVSEAADGLADVALTTRPASADGIVATGRHQFVYAPVSVSAVSIAYWIDNPATGKPVTSLKLDQRLVDKLLTQSYNFQNEGTTCSAPPPPQGIGCDKGVPGSNPLTLFADPEFKKLNPAVQPVTGYGAAFQVPTVQSGHSDMTWSVTRWIAANADASKFQQGTPDPWGMRVNSYYKDLKYPVDSFTAMDPYPVIAHKYSPVFPLSLADSYQAENWDPGTSWQKDQYGNYPKDPIQIPGERALIAILDEASAAAFRFPVAAIPNASGRYVEPDNTGMAAALGSLTPAGSGTQQVNLQGGNPAAYPLTMVIYAMVPISGVSRAKAGAIARFLDFAAGPGQTAGVRPGQLPAGYLPLPANLRAQTRKIAVEVANQTGDRPGGQAGNPGGPASGSGAGAHGPSSAASSSSSAAQSAHGSSASQPGTSGPGSGTPARLVADAHPPTSALTRFALPALLILGGAAALGGTFTGMGSAETPVATRLRRLRRKR
jgi:ABC-type phosphate transport system substrate-binding protein